MGGVRLHLGGLAGWVLDVLVCTVLGSKEGAGASDDPPPRPPSLARKARTGCVQRSCSDLWSRLQVWSAMRNTIISLYQPTHLAGLIPTVQSYIDSATRHLSSTQNDDVTFSDLSLRLATDVIGEAAFGVDFGLSGGSPPDGERSKDGEVSEFIKEHVYSTTSLKMDLSGSFSIVLGLIVPVLQEPVRQLLKRIPGTVDWKIHRTNLNLSKRLEEIVAKRASERDRGSKDFLSAILNARDSDGASRKLFTSDYISALTYEHLLAGSATTSFTLSSVLYLVSNHPEVEQKLVQEIDGFGPIDLIPTADDLQHEFPYLDQVIKEAMRFYTVSPLVARETSRPVEVGGFLLPKVLLRTEGRRFTTSMLFLFPKPKHQKSEYIRSIDLYYIHGKRLQGTWVWLAPGVLAKDPKHFPEPHLFRPERFDPACDEEKQRHPYAHIPFGIGPRACVGQKFSLQEIKLAVIHLYRHYVFRHSPSMESPLEFQYGVVLNFKHGVKLRVIRRSKALHATM
ncbi:hypothetical protein BHM03_00009391 [Ensete ventricosum]|nr:hypothetical protein BHM03_00009391 [Ensete ventricosum]